VAEMRLCNLRVVICKHLAYTTIVRPHACYTPSFLKRSTWTFRQHLRMASENGEARTERSRARSWPLTREWLVSREAVMI